MKNEKELIKFWYNKIRGIKYLGGECVICGSKNVKHLTFHHKDPSIKDFKISSKLSNSWGYIKDEIDKCILMCNNCHLSHHYTNNILSENKKSICAKNRRQKSKKLFINYKGGECCNCGYNVCAAALTFHHIDKKAKSFIISSNSRLYRSIPDVIEEMRIELDKCQILCANCHNEEQINHAIVDYVTNNYDSISIRKKSVKIDREMVKNMYNKGMSQKEIAKELNVAKGTIWGIIKELK